MVDQDPTLRFGSERITPPTGPRTPWRGTQQTEGQMRVRVYFNPYGNEMVEVIKTLTASLIDLCERLKAKDPRLAALAQTAYEEAAMWAVKAATAD